MSRRKTAVCGTFYPNSQEEIKKNIKNFNNSFKLENKTTLDIKAIIVPHAGYIYSGFTANLAYNLSATINSRKDIKRIIVIGPSHRIYIDGSSIALYDSFETPLGDIKIDLEYSKSLVEKYQFLNFFEEAHHEHSTETQAPFIKNYFEDIRLVELVYGKQDFTQLSILIDELLEDEQNFVVISTDLSHFYTQEEAKRLDNICLKAIETMDLNLLDAGCEACGKIGVKALIKSALTKGYKTKLLHYCTSYDATKDATRVVGYTSALLIKE